MKRSLALLVAVFLLLPATAAQADDAGLWGVYSAENAEVQKVGTQWERELKRWDRSRGRRWRPLYKASVRLDELGAGIAAQIEGQQPSSSTGAKVKKLVLASIAESRRGFRLTGAAARSLAQGRRGALSQAKRADQAFARAARYDRRAVRGFKALGFERR